MITANGHTANRGWFITIRLLNQLVLLALLAVLPTPCWGGSIPGCARCATFSTGQRGTQERGSALETRETAQCFFQSFRLF